MTATAISITDISKSFGREQVLTGLSLALEKGAYLGLIGKNGAGKTTLIKSILDFIALDAGCISIFGRSSLQTEARDKLAYLPEKFIPPYYLSGQDFLEYMLRLYRQPYEPTRLENILGMLDLDLAALKKPVREFSKGMAQKLGLAACLLSNKALLILDEPMSGLDPKARAYLKRYLLKLKARGQTLFFSTHMLADVEALCDCVAILHDGNIQFMGSPAQCCETFASDDFEEAYLRCIGAAEDVPLR